MSDFFKNAQTNEVVNSILANRKREQESNATNPRTTEEEKENLETDREDEGKLEIPAFLRRQAN